MVTRSGAGWLTTLSAVALTLLGMTPCQAWSTDGAGLQAVRVEAALENASSDLENVAWIDRSTLIAVEKGAPGHPASLLTIDVDTGHSNVIAQGRYPSVSPDRRWIAFLEDGRWKLQSLADRKRVDLDLPQISGAVVFQPPAWSLDGRRLAIVEDSRDRPSAPVEAGAPGVEVLGEQAARHSGEYRARITVLDVASRERRSLQIDNAVYYGSWSKQGLFYYVEMQMRSPTYTRMQAVSVADVPPRTVWSQDGGIMQSARPAVSPDGRRIAFVADVDFKRWDDFDSVVLLDVATGKARRLSSSIYANRDVLWSSDSSKLYLAARCGGFTELYALSLSGKLQALTGCERRNFNLARLAGANLVSYETEDGYGRRDIRAMDADTGAERVISTLADPTTQFRLGKFEQLRYPTLDGLKLYGFLVYPPDFDPNRKYPLYVDVHGGGPGAPLAFMGPLTGLSTGQYSPLEWQAWAALGYLVFVPDYRSSGEYGPDIARMRYQSGDIGGVMRDALDVDEGVRWLLSKSFIDSNRVAVLGHSAGGARVNYLLTHSHLYRAGILSDPIGSGAIAYLLERTTGQNTGERFESFRGWGFDAHTDGVKFSTTPTAYLSGFLFDGYKSTTPTLIFVGNEAKGAMHPLSAEVLFSMLRQYGVPARMLRYGNDGHNPSDSAAAISRFEEVRHWLETYIPLAPQ